MAARLALLLTALALVAPALAHAGTYDVVTCQNGGGLYANLAWAVANVPAVDGRYATDASCAGAADPIGVALTPGYSYPAGTEAQLRFQAPPGTTIANYQLRLVMDWATGGATTDAIVTLGDSVVLGAGQWDPAVQKTLNDREGRWLGYLGGFGGKQVQDIPETRLVLQRGASPLALAVPAPTSMSLQAGCWALAPAPGCSLGSAARVAIRLTGSTVTIDDPSPPALSVSGGGLLTPGARTGAEGVGLSANDNTGIRRAELVDVTNPALPVVVGLTPNVCDYRRPLPCPNLPTAVVEPTKQLVGRHTLLVRVTDAAGNQTASAPFAILARGPGNGTNAGDGARLSAGFRATVVRRVKAKRRRVRVLRSAGTVAFGGEPTLRGTLRNAAGRAIAGARLRLTTREARRGAPAVPGATVKTRKDGSFAVELAAGASRTIALSYTPFPGDDRPGASRGARLTVRAGVSLTAPARVKRGRAATFSGRLSGRPVPPRAVKLDLQRSVSRTAWKTVRTTTARADGRFRLAVRPPAGRPVYRVLVRPGGGYPYAAAESRVARLRVG